MATRTLLVTIFALACLTFAAEAKSKECKISVLGGSWKGQTYALEMQDGKFVGTSGVSDSNVPGCVAKKYIFGRWYHLCKNNRIVVFKRKNDVWKRLSAKNLKKYKHNCL